MSNMWGIHNDVLGSELVDGGFIARKPQRTLAGPGRRR